MSRYIHKLIQEDDPDMRMSEITLKHGCWFVQPCIHSFLRNRLPIQQPNKWNVRKTINASLLGVKPL